MLAGGCGSAETRVAEGSVIDVVGGLTDLESFTIVDESGRRFVFTPNDDATFHGGPLGHLRDHLRSGEPVTVRYREGESLLVALEISD